MKYIVKYNSKNSGLDSIIYDIDTIENKRNLKNELYGVFYISNNSNCPNQKLVSFIPHHLHLRNTSILNDDFEEYLNITVNTEIDDFDIIYEVISNVLEANIERENLLILIA